MSAPDSLPAVVMQVASIEFQPTPTAILYQPQLEGFCLTRRVYRDSQQRFPDGRLIRTSTVVEFHEDQGYLIAQTFSGSRHVLLSATGADVAELGGWKSFFSSCH
ncbi:TPA: hypothetical protein NII21_005998 [Pseudomonas aeruginosa]|uniref:hypothetical protein n=1 Tax=Pseudomonas aeruginosa TaxID=287 RepID=UPI00053D234E|nr:hypothetical protein [Pseudomonas aeruginosa]ELD5770465.1 hypothetical protein [Pseudomonas aeruginosa]MBG4035089.1 hypothetical protein [Pseudomonas aeruginosa]MBG7063745.1 hypothetical protein [Pseudomonas aeruginosa]MBH3964830.1 hypothetical protein [Pseudomonas aeruginosa]MBH4157655.1 hypothetical protein [Pseudomonas aeruginosa]